MDFMQGTAIFLKYRLQNMNFLIKKISNIQLFLSTERGLKTSNFGSKIIIPKSGNHCHFFARMRPWLCNLGKVGPSFRKIAILGHI